MELKFKNDQLSPDKKEKLMGQLEAGIMKLKSNSISADNSISYHPIKKYESLKAIVI